MIAVYGANGFIGRHVVNALVQTGEPVRAVSRSFDAQIAFEWRHHADLVEADFSNSLSMLSSLQGVDTVVQLVSSSSPGLGNQVLIDDIQENVLPHVRFMRNAIDAGVKRYIFISSGGTVYGPNVSFPTPETASTCPISSHGLTKLMIEKYLQMFGAIDGLNYVILRVSNPYGTGQSFRKGQGLIPAVLQRYALGKPVQVFGDGESQRDYIHVSDLVTAITQAVRLPNLNNEVINIGCGVGHSVVQVLDAIEEIAGIVFEREFCVARGTDVGHSILDVSRAQVRLGWQPQVSFSDGLRMTLEDAM